MSGKKPNKPAHIMQPSVDMHIHGESPGRLAKKYDVEMNSDNDQSFEDVANEEEEKLKNELSMAQMTEGLELAQRTQGLISKLDDKNREIERLCVLLESIEPVPGLDAEKFLNLYDKNNDLIADYRDTKIVALAKKSRNLTVALNKEKTLTMNLKGKNDDLQRTAEKLSKELQALSSPAARAAALKSSRAAAANSSSGAPAGPSVPTVDSVKKELHHAQKQVEDLRVRQNMMQEENKKLTRLLTKELGDGSGSSLEQALSSMDEVGGWKGRAQQIVQLKNKVKRLESQRGETDERETKSSKDGVNGKAEKVVASMMSERQNAIDQMVEERERLAIDCEKLTEKTTAQKARIRNLENDSAKQKQNMKILLEKTDADDELVGELRREVERLRSQVVKAGSEISELKQCQQSHGKKISMQRDSHAVIGGMEAAEKEKMLERELQRYRRICEQQAAQLDTQDEVIGKLRSAQSQVSSGGQKSR